MALAANEKKTIGVIGAGSWGTALAITLSNKGHEVRITDLDQAMRAEKAEKHENTKYLPGAKFGDHLTPVKDAETALKDADVALIPVGGTYTYNAAEAIELIKRTTPKLTVPMHFSSEAGFFGLKEIGTIEGFLTKAQRAGLNVNIAKVCFYDTEVKDLNDCILALRPQNV